MGNGKLQWKEMVCSWSEKFWRCRRVPRHHCLAKDTPVVCICVEHSRSPIPSHTLRNGCELGLAAAVADEIQSPMNQCPATGHLLDWAPSAALWFSRWLSQISYPAGASAGGLRPLLGVTGAAQCGAAATGAQCAAAAIAARCAVATAAGAQHGAAAAARCAAAAAVAAAALSRRPGGSAA